MTTQQVRPPRSGLVVAVRVLVAGVVAGALVVLLVTNENLVAELVDAIGDGRPLWLVVAVLAEVVSIAALARQQRRLLSVHGGHFTLRSVLATTYGGNVISTSLPVVGAAAAAVFAFRRYTGLGAETTIAGWALMMSGIFSSISFGAVVATGAILTGHTGAAISGLLGLVFVVLPASVVILGIRRPRIRAGVERHAVRFAGVLRRRLPKAAGRVRDEGIIDGVEKVASFRLGVGGMIHVLALSLLNWLADAACLSAVLMAITGRVPWQSLLLVWAAGAGVSTLKLTPGGIGVVEAALTAALAGVGFPTSLALGSVLVYRAISLWFVAGVGGVTLLALRSRRHGEPEAGWP
jgi:putative heme transporter